MPDTGTPVRELAVVVPSHDRPLRLRWLLNALEQQTLDGRRFEVVVAHDSTDSETERLLRTHPLAAAGVLRHLSFPPGTAGPAVKRNAAWRECRAPLVAFTDDDCRPAQNWAEVVLAAGTRDPDCVLQGRTMPDPDESAILQGAPWAHTVAVEPPSLWGETCNIAYPRRWLERLGGFDERFPVASGEDTDLLLRALAGGARLVVLPEALAYHAVEPTWLGSRLAMSMRWRHLAFVVKRHPRLRQELIARVWWKREHAELAMAVAGVTLAPRRRTAALLAVPWLGRALGYRGRSARGRARATLELPGRAALDAAEIVALLWGSVRYGTVML